VFLSSVFKMCCYTWDILFASAGTIWLPSVARCLCAIVLAQVFTANIMNKMKMKCPGWRR